MPIIREERFKLKSDKEHSIPLFPGPKIAGNLCVFFLHFEGETLCVNIWGSPTMYCVYRCSLLCISGLVLNTAFKLTRAAAENTLKSTVLTMAKISSWHFRHLF